MLSLIANALFVGGLLWFLVGAKELWRYDGDKPANIWDYSVFIVAVCIILGCIVLYLPEEKENYDLTYDYYGNTMIQCENVENVWYSNDQVSPAAAKAICEQYEKEGR